MPYYTYLEYENENSLNTDKVNLALTEFFSGLKYQSGILVGALKKAEDIIKILDEIDTIYQKRRLGIRNPHADSQLIQICIIEFRNDIKALCFSYEQRGQQNSDEYKKIIFYKSNLFSNKIITFLMNKESSQRKLAIVIREIINKNGLKI